MEFSELVARTEIRELLASYCFLIDEYKVDELAGLFVADCITDFGPGLGGEVQGIAALRDRLFASQARFARTHHQLGQSRIKIDGSRAHALTAATALHEWHDGTQETLWFRYEDGLKLVDRDWYFVSRQLHVSAKSGFGGHEFRFLDRRSTVT
jgi:hypothetical protein